MESFASLNAIPQELATVATVAIFIGFLKWAVDKLVPAIEAFQQAVKESMDANTEAVRESHKYLKHRNGSLEKSNKEFADQLDTIAKTQEQTADKLERLDEKV